MTESVSSNESVLHKVEKTIAGIIDFVLQFLLTNISMFRAGLRLVQIMGESSQSRFTQPYTFLFVNTCLAFLSYSHFPRDAGDLPIVIAQYQQITLEALVLSIVPAIILVVLVGMISGNLVASGNDVGRNILLRTFCYGVGHQFLAYVLAAFLMSLINVSFRPLNNRLLELYIPTLFGFAVEIYTIAYLPMLIFWGVLRNPHLVKGANFNKSMVLAILFIATFLGSFYLFSEPFLMGSEKAVFATSPSYKYDAIHYSPFRSREEGNEKSIDLTIVLTHYRRHSLVIFNELIVSSATDDYPFSCTFYIQYPASSPSGLITLQPGEAVIIDASVNIDVFGCEYFLGKENFRVRITGYDEGAYYSSGEIEVKTYIK